MCLLKIKYINVFVLSNKKAPQYLRGFFVIKKEKDIIEQLVFLLL